jgi:hypothetical protein
MNDIYLFRYIRTIETCQFYTVLKCFAQRSRFWNMLVQTFTQMDFYGEEPRISTRSEAASARGEEKLN